MGRYLALLPFDSDMDGGPLPRADRAYAHTILDTFQDSALQDALESVKTERVPDPFNTHLSGHSNSEEAEAGYGNTQEDGTGTALRCALAGEIVAAGSFWASLRSKNTAVWAYLRQLPPTTRVALFWR